MPAFVAGRQSLVVVKPEHVLPHLGAKESSWKPGGSSYELAQAWVGAQGLPTAIRQALETDEAFRQAALERGHFEKRLSLRSMGGAIQVDLLAHLKLAGRARAAAVVEAQAGEGFGETIGEWDDGSFTRPARLTRLADDLRLELRAITSVPYKLMALTAAALYEADVQGYQRALLLIHSFGEPSHVAELELLARLLGVPLAGPDVLSGPACRLGVDLFLGWIQDSSTDERSSR